MVAILLEIKQMSLKLFIDQSGTGCSMCAFGCLQDSLLLQDAFVISCCVIWKVTTLFEVFIMPTRTYNQNALC